ncbi:MAG TPA: PA2778 family cysteine peptidase [Nevskiaceae bacterium]|nr:PA2778 family cysteine peptidase [Nevskiaceae bacterium]
MGAALRRIAPAAALLLSACALAPSHPPLRASAVELADTPFFPQDIHQCGPAALATVLVADGVAATPEALTDEVYVPGRKGSFQAELVAAVRRHERVPVSVGAGLPALIAALDAGEPVLVLQNLGLGFWPRWHYAVVVGYEPQSDRFLLRSGTTRRETMRAQAFERTWRLGSYWAIAVAPPDAPPAFATAASWIGAAAPFESLSRPAIAETAYRAAVTRWPDAALPWQALANTRYAARDLPGAEAALREALARAPDAATRNNLANVLLERGCVGAAREQLEAIAEIPPGLSKAIAETRAAVEAAPPESCAP